MLDLYKNIKTLRLENGWSQSELAKRAGYKDRSAIAHIEDGSVDLPQSKIQLFADIYGVTPARLFGRSTIEELPRSGFTEEEIDLIDAYRKADDTRKDIVCDVLHVKRDAGSTGSRVG